MRSIRRVMPLMAVFTFTSCFCYRSRVTADFHDHAYTNVGRHREINAWWRDGDGFHSDTNPVVMLETRDASGGQIRVGFIRPPGRDVAVVVESIAMKDRQGKPVGIGKRTPFTLAIKTKEFPLFVPGSKAGDVMRGFAEFKLQREFSVANAPYVIELTGHYRKSGGGTERIDTRIRMDLRRERKLANIADCWP